MPFRAGQTYLFPLNHETQKEHLWVIATDPDADGRFATVSFTSLRGAKDQTVVLRKNEHQFINWDTCVLYIAAEISSGETLQRNLDCGSAKMHSDLSAEILQLVLDGFSASDFTKNRVRDFVRDYRRARAARASQLRS